MNWSATSFRLRREHKLTRTEACSMIWSQTRCDESLPPVPAMCRSAKPATRGVRIQPPGGHVSGADLCQLFGAKPKLVVHDLD